MKGHKGEHRNYEWEIPERESEHERLLTLGNELGVVKREVGGGWGEEQGDRHLGDTWWDDHWMLFYMLANWTPIKVNLKKILKKKIQL